MKTTLDKQIAASSPAYRSLLAGGVLFALLAVASGCRDEPDPTPDPDVGGREGLVKSALLLFCLTAIATAQERGLGPDERVFLEIDAPHVVVGAFELGAHLRPLGNTVYIVPPLNIEDADLDQLLGVVRASTERVLLPAQ